MAKLSKERTEEMLSALLKEIDDVLNRYGLKEDEFFMCCINENTCWADINNRTKLDSNQIHMTIDREGWKRKW